ncbi:Ger(x)C family spore germination protein [Pelosinus sp. UFO1]|uniref:Ger(x)C family spore germination protein n=1 Tax=Pelosinus sp. UFO1 TaxID=484770 RepID=UPI0004D1F608|nr:Ger(x)C family spore germination protein [Pelosinus sp. UFO1]AIF50342.1 germination protein, Ger(x)C family [Pelosinus sp. UFO1]
MKKGIAFFMIYIIMFLTVGCMAKTEIEKLAIVVTFGVDITTDGKYMISTQILKTQKQSPGGMGGSKGEKQPTEVMALISTGDTIPDALDHLSKELGKKVALSHVKFIVIGEDAAKAGIAELMDFSARGYQLRPNVVFLVTSGKASEILRTSTPEDSIPANAIAAILNLQANYGYVPVTTTMEFANSLASKTAAPMAGVISLHGDEQVGRVFKMIGIAVFKKDKLIGYMMGEEEVRGVQWIRDKVKAGNIVMPSPNKGSITIEIISASSEIKSIVKDNKPIIHITINKKGNIRGMVGDLDAMKNPEILTEFEQLENEVIKKEVEKALYAAQKTFKADIFDFGETIHRDYPDEWKNIEESWSEIFPDLEVEVEVHSSIQRIGVISKPLY